MALLPATAKRQNLLFSATFSSEIKKLADQLLNAPQLIEVARRNTAAETVSQSVYKVAADQKRALLEHIVTSRNLWQVLCFVRTKHGASRLARQLEKDGLKTTAIHGDKSQAARLEALDDFKSANVQVMVATDVAARGLDIDDLPLVVNYEMPYVPEDYIHRIGRTGRAGQTGEAISLCAPEEEKLLSEIERLLKRSIPVAAMENVAASQSVSHTRQRSAPRSARHEARHGASPALPRRDRTHAEVDRNPDQPRAARTQERAPAPALTSAKPGANHGPRRQRPIPALLLKRSAREPEKV